MTEDLLPALEIEPPQGPALTAVVWLHGLGADGYDFEPIVPHLGLDPALRTRFVFPHAPAMPVTINGGFVMPAWYDILSPDLNAQPDREGIRRSAEAVAALLAHEEERGVPAGQIVLAGFSQGGAIALHLGLRYPKRLAGILALSTYLLDERATDVERTEANAATPIFQAHGTFDPMVPFARGRHSRERLRAMGCDVRWAEYPMEHEVCEEEIADVGAWLNEVLGSPAGAHGEAHP
jgi:phospholipase/carboxylesterase